MLSPPCPAAVLRAAAAYAAFEATSQGWLITRSSWSAASVLQASSGAAGAWRPAPDSTALATASTAAPSPHNNSGPGPWHRADPQPQTIIPHPHPRSPHLRSQTLVHPHPHPHPPVLPTAGGGAPWPPLRWAPPLTTDAAAAAAAAAAAPGSMATLEPGPLSSLPRHHHHHHHHHPATQRPPSPGDLQASWPCFSVPGRSAAAAAATCAVPAPAGRRYGGATVPPPPHRPPAHGHTAEAPRASGGGGGALAATAAAAASQPFSVFLWRRPEAAAAAALARRSASTAASPPPPPTPVDTPAAAAAAAAGGATPPPPQHPISPPSSPPAPSSPSAPSSPARGGFVSGGYDVASFPPARIRNFSIIAHVDHGKSTLADRLMELTGALGGRATHNAQYLDKLQVERERGITVKAQTVSLVYEHRGVPYLLNLIDTPGHVDFSYEVSRSLAACQGALLVVDAGQGIQAQTVANFYLAFEQGMDLIPVVNKIDLPAADPRGCAEQMAAAFDLDPAGVLFTSAKTGQGLEGVLPAVIERVRPPRGDPSAPLRMLLFDAFHDDYRGVVLLVEVVDGQVAVGQRVAMASTGAAYEVQEVGLQAPERHPTGRLLTGQVGYLLCGIKDLKAARVGDTLYAASQAQQQQQQQGQEAPAAPPPRLPGFKPAKAMVFAGLFPLGGDGQEFESLATAMDKLLLNDASVVVKRENSEALGPGFRCGFLGMLHMEIFTQRLQHEYGASVVTTTPMVPYILEMPDGSTTTLESASDYPVDKKVSQILEPTVTATLISPDACLGRLMELCAGRRGEQLEHASLGGGRTLLRYRLPLAELAGDFYSAVKSRSQGYASFDYEEGPYRPADLVRLDILAHGQPVDALARMVPRGEAATVGRALLLKMKDALDRQQFEVVLQAAANGKIVARETIKALRKNVTAKCYGGDVSRKRKLLDRQKEGKRRMKRLGSIDVPQELFPELMRTR